MKKKKIEPIKNLQFTGGVKPDPRSFIYATEALCAENETRDKINELVDAINELRYPLQKFK